MDEGSVVVEYVCGGVVKLSDGKDMRRLILTGAIWNIPQFWQKAIDAYEKQHLVTREEFLAHAPAEVRHAYAAPLTQAEEAEIAEREARATAKREAQEATARAAAKQWEEARTAQHPHAIWWTCPEHGVAQGATNYSGQWTNRCSVDGCLRTYPPMEPHPESVLGPDGWECPTHGRSGLRKLTSGQGRVYRSCIFCREFER